MTYYIARNMSLQYNKNKNYVKKRKILTKYDKDIYNLCQRHENRRDNMTSEEVESLSRKLAYLEKINPLKFENFKGRLEALYEMEIEKDTEYITDKN